jgi:hypothetical protein
MSDIKDDEVTLTDDQLLIAKKYIKESVIALEAVLASKDHIPDGMIMVAMCRLVGTKIRQVTLALGPETRKRHVDKFCELIKLHAFDEGENKDEEAS